MPTTHGTWTAIIIIIVLLFSLWIYVLMSNKRANDARKRTNERLKSIEESHKTIAKTQGVMVGIQSDVHMIKQYLMDQGTKK